MKKYKVHIIWGIAFVLALVGGYSFGKSTVANARSGSFASGVFSSSTRGRFSGAGGNGGGFASGQIAAIDGQSLTLQLANGNSEVVFYSSSTLVTEPTNVSISALKSGVNVMIGGTTNSDGSLTAQSIQVRKSPAGQ